MRAPYQYMDRLFKDIFSDKVRLLSLYNALSGSNYTNPDDLEVTTIESIIYVTMKNDLSFLIAAYSMYISRIHSNMTNGMSKDEAVKEAVDFAVKENLLGGYFGQKKMEVLNMSLYEFV